MDCLDIMASRNQGKGFFLQKLATDNGLYFTGIAVSELAGAGRTKTPEGREVVAADLVGTNLGSVTHSLLGLALVNSGASFPVSFAARSTLSVGLIFLQSDVVYPTFMSKNAEQRATSIRNFDLGWMAGKMALNSWLDKYIIQELPGRLFDSCVKGSKVSVIFSPGMVRIYEKTGSTALYYMTREAITGQ
jgi:hypothetical protein